MNFRADNEAPIAEPILQAIIDANIGSEYAYGGDSHTARLKAVLTDLFEHEVAVFPLLSGTAANALCMGATAPPYGAIFCHAQAHMQVDECGAPELQTGGAKLIPIAGDHGRLSQQCLEDQLSNMGLKGDHDPLPAVLSLTQATECGTVYSVEQIRSLCKLAHKEGMTTHMDGARFGNAVVSLGRSPADITWRAGIDMLSFGATKNGALAAEAAIFFDLKLAQGFGKRRMKAGHLLSKMRYLSAQLIAYVKEDLWLNLAAKANEGARQLETTLAECPATSVVHPVQANEIFVRMDETTDQQLRKAGFEYHPWPGSPGLFRLVVPYCVAKADIDKFARTLARCKS